MTYLTVTELNKTYHDHFGQVSGGIKNINLTINQGEIVAILGTNGAGKSTLLNCIHGEVMPASGKIILDNEDVTSLSVINKASIIGRVYQDPNRGTASRMTVFENLVIASKKGHKRGLSISIKTEQREQFKAYLRSFNLNLENLLDTPIGLLSGGQRQIITLLMATMNQPKLLILDEHTAALDPKTSRNIMTLTNELIQKNRLTTLMVTHQINQAIDYANRILILHQGEIVHEITKVQESEITSQEIYSMMEALM